MKASIEREIVRYKNQPLVSRTCDGTALGLSLVTLLIAAVVLLAASVGTTAWGRRSSNSCIRPRLQPLVTRYFTLLQDPGRQAAADVHRSGFQLQRADGSAELKRGKYLTNLPTIDRFYLSKVVATQAYGTLVVRYALRVEGTANGKPYAGAIPTPLHAPFPGAGRHGGSRRTRISIS